MSRATKFLIDEEVTFNDGEELVSTTDIRGVITYANEVFCRVAGYSYEELVGNNHNIVRHPDMPREAFKDLWEHLKQNKPWRGAVKNRCKDGRYYWVDAFVMPIYKEGQLIGYQSVRRKIAYDTRLKAEQVYKRLREKKRVGGRLRLSYLNKLLLIAVVIAISAGVAWLYTPYILILPTFFTLLLLHNDILTYSSHNKKLQEQYDGISRFVYCLKPYNYAEFHLAMSEGSNNTIFGRISGASDELLNRVSILENISGRSSKSISLQNSDLESVATSIEEMIATISEIARNSSLSLELVQNASHACRSSNNKVIDVEQKVADMSNEVQLSSEKMDMVEHKITAINNVMSEIQGVAAQTNLLALNAAIEAARAGAQGRGFAVVADEVRVLSQRTQKAVEGIQYSVQEIFDALTQLKVTMKNSTQIAQGCMESTISTRAEIESLTNAFSAIDDSALQISTAAEEQSVVAKDIGTNIHNIRKLSSSNAEDASALAKQAQDVRVMAEQLEEIGLSFKT